MHVAGRRPRTPPSDVQSAPRHARPLPPGGGTGRALHCRRNVPLPTSSSRSEYITVGRIARLVCPHGRSRGPETTGATGDEVRGHPYWVTTTEAAEVLGVTATRVRQLVRR